MYQKSKRKRLTICEKIACRGGLSTPVRIRMPASAGGDSKSNFLLTHSRKASGGSGGPCETARPSIFISISVIARKVNTMNTPNQIKSHYYDIRKYQSNSVICVAEIKTAYSPEIKMLGAKMLQAFLANLTFTVQLIREDDGSLTASVEELDLFENAASKDKCMMLLLEDMKEYAHDFYSEFELWSSAPNRRKHIPYVAKILCMPDEKLLEAMRCRHNDFYKR